jgi:hypothetical protein
MRHLTTYQIEIARAVLDSVLHDRGLLFTVELPRGAGVRELSAQLELLMLTLHVNDGVRLLRVAPHGSEGQSQRLAGFLRESALQGLWSAGRGTVRLGRSVVRYVASDELGPTLVEPRFAAVGLIEVADAHLVDREVYERWIEPLASSSGATTVLYGTPLNGETHFERLKQANRDREADDGLRRHFRVAPETAAEALPHFQEQLDEARARLGEEHPEFQNAYLLRPVAATEPLLGRELLRGLEEGDRLHEPSPGASTVASVLVTRLPGEVTRLPDERGTTAPTLLSSPGASAVLSIAERDAGGGVRLVEHRWIQAIDAASLAKRATSIAGEWRCERMAAEVRAAAGHAGAAFRTALERGMPYAAIEWIAPDAASDSRQLSDLIAFAGTGRLRLYHVDGSPEHRTLRHELESAVAEHGTDGLMRLVLPDGDEGFLWGLVRLCTPWPHPHRFAWTPARPRSRLERYRPGLQKRRTDCRLQRNYRGGTLR